MLMREEGCWQHQVKLLWEVDASTWCKPPVQATRVEEAMDDRTRRELKKDETPFLFFCRSENQTFKIKI